MRNPNGFGGIRKLSGNRRKPYQALVTTGWELVDGKPKQKQRTIGCYATRKEALTALAVYSDDPSVFDNKISTFSDLWDDYQKVLTGKSYETQKHKLSFYRQSESIHAMKLDHITAEDLQRIVSTKKTKGTQGQYISFYRDIFRYAQSQGYTKKDPSAYLQTTLVKDNSLINPFTYDEMLKMPRDYMLFFYTGLRAQEMLNLKVEHILYDDMLIKVPGTKTDSASRYVPVHPDILPILKERTNNIWTAQRSYRTLLTHVTDLTGGRHATHDFRRTFATCLDRNGVDEITIKRLLGHHLNSVTQDHYIKPDMSKLFAAINALDFSVL